MPVNNDTLNNQLYDTLRSKGYDPIALDSKGDPNNEVEKADVFRLNFTQDGKTQHAWATIEGNDLVLYIDDNFTKIDEFEPFTRYMKVWAQRKLLGFNVSNKDHLVNDMRKRTVMKNKEKLGEGYYPMGKKASYNDSVPQVKIILQHTRQIEEGEQRFRNIARIFVENTNGERFLLPTTRPGLARVYARHIAEGGTPYDERGHHITKLVEDYSKMAGFVRATRNGQFNESALKLVNEGLSYYNNLRMTLQGMASHRGYNKYFENYTPVLNEESEDNTSLNELFVQETLDPRIESVMPILKRLSKNVSEISEVKELEEWAETITEVEDETTKTLAEPAEDMLESGELSKGGHRYSERPYVCVHAKKGKVTVYADTSYDAVKKAAQKWGLKSTAGIDAHLADVIHTPVNEAPGAETLKHNQDTEKSNLKAFDLEEELKAKVYFVTQKGTDKVVGTWNGEVFKPFDRTKYPAGTMDMVPNDCEVDKVSGPIDKEQFDKVKAVNEKTVDEDLDANQKRVGQLGPTEKVGPKGAVGKLVGASESINYDEDSMLINHITKLAGR